MTLTQLASFVAVARGLSFRRAAEHLNLAQPSVSTHIRDLERELGVQLFERLGRSVLLTQAGGVLLEHAARVLAAADEARAAVAEVNEVWQGVLSLGTTPSLIGTLLPPVVRRLQLDAPAVTLRLGVATSEEVVAGLRRGDYDLAIAYLTHPEPTLTTIPLLDDEFILVAPPGDPLTQRGPLPFNELHGRPLIVLAPETAGRIVMDRAFAARSVQPLALMELVSSDAIKRMVAAGVGPAIVSRLAVAWELDMGMFDWVPFADTTLRHPVVALTRAGHTPSGPVRAGLHALAQVYPHD